MIEDIDVINKTVIGSFFILGMLVGSTITVIYNSITESKGRD